MSPKTIPILPADLDQALALHRNGRLVDASTLYQRILTARPDEIKALHGLALVAIDLGRPAEAIPLLARCLVADRNNPVYRTSLGLALLRMGDAEQAAAHLLEAANLAPEFADPRLHLARALAALGRRRQAVEVLADTAKLFPARADVWAAKGNAERSIRRHGAAEQSLRRALALAPDDPEILNNLGVAVRAQGRVADAIGYYRQALTLAPNHATTHANLGNALVEMGLETAAESHLRRAVQLDPTSVEATCNLAIFLTREERPDEAIPQFRAALKIAPQHVDALTNLGVALLATGDTKEAERCYRHAIALHPANAEAHYNLAWLLLLTGQWREGWHEYEWRWKLPHFSSRVRAFTQPLWDGSPLSGTLLLHAEQGLGDAIQFVRYATLAKQRCAHVFVECPRPLVRLFQGLAGVDTVAAAGAALPACDAHAPFISLPRLFATTPETTPSANGFLPLRADPPEHLRVPSQARRRIGLVWAGSPDNKIDRRRNCPVQLFAPLMAITNADFVSLQVGPRAHEIRALPAEKISFACDGRVDDFADTAAVIGQLDLVIGVDTAAIHLAAAMGKPTWLLLPFMPDYRWLLGRDDSPWYASIRLFRQSKPGDWPGVFARLATALTDWQHKQTKP